MFPEPGQEAMRQMFVERWAENDAHAWRAALDAIVGWSVTHRLEEICCPVLVVAGDQDTTPVATKRAYAARIPDARVAVVSDSRHGTPVDQPERFNETVLSFLSEQSRARL
jgi:pimeloyl-ACP methyl ester carboxylesterase